MSKAQIRALRELACEYRKNKPMIEKKLRKAGVTKPDSALVFTAAIYYKALDRLAKA